MWKGIGEKERYRVYDVRYKVLGLWYKEPEKYIRNSGVYYAKIVAGKP
jgi:hypothetical protein